MYKIREEKIKEIKDGRTLTILAEILDINISYLSLIFTRKRACSGLIAKGLISIKKNTSMNDDRMEEYLEYYFTREEE